ncbi:unnamed protein product, partial [Echinostoma caproni]|uniref:SET domain-containing protein n=1 Tax=Echinostoma caproni TaxID=27848 RepID=A0A183BH17_9TREM
CSAAHKLCEVEGEKRGLQLFVPGIREERNSSFFPDTATVITSWHVMLNRAGDLRAGWRMSDPGFANHETDSSDCSKAWYTAELHVPNEVIALYENRGQKSGNGIRDGRHL